MEHPKLVAWFDDLEDAVTTALMLTVEQRSEVKARKAPRADTWVMLAKDSESRDALRAQLRAAQRKLHVPVARDCRALTVQQNTWEDEDTFDEEHGFASVEVDYVEEGTLENIRRELLSDAADYAASGEAGWYYAIMDGEHDIEGDDWL